MFRENTRAEVDRVRRSPFRSGRFGFTRETCLGNVMLDNVWGLYRLFKLDRDWQVHIRCPVLYAWGWSVGNSNVLLEATQVQGVVNRAESCFYNNGFVRCLWQQDQFLPRSQGMASPVLKPLSIAYWNFITWYTAQHIRFSFYLPSGQHKYHQSLPFPSLTTTLHEERFTIGSK